MRLRTRTIHCLLACIAIGAGPVTVFAEHEVIVRPDEITGETGRYLTGVHFVYSYEKDSIYEDDSFARWARNAGVAVARFPGGTVVQYWHWEDPTGYMKGDPWNDPDTKRAPPSNWMSMDEYLHFVDVSGVTPLIGINLLSGVRNERIEDSVTRAVEQVKYIVAQGHKGAFYYLGNEDMAHLGGLEATANVFVVHARAIKGVDPSAKLFWNDNYINKARLRKFLEIAGEYADGVEFHGKWSYGDQQRQTKIHFSDWQRQYPFSTEKWGRFSERALVLRRHANELGYPNLMFANNEYGLAPFEPERFVDFDRYKFGLVAIEFLQDLFIGQFDMAAFWSNVPEKTLGSGKEGRRLINTDHGNRLNPVHFGLEMLASAQGKRLVRITGDRPDGYGFAVLSDDTLEVFLLNKSDSESRVCIRVIAGATVLGSIGSIRSLVDTPDHWGKLEEASVDVESQSFNAVLPPLSFSEIVIPIVPTAIH